MKQPTIFDVYNKNNNKTMATQLKNIDGTYELEYGFNDKQLCRLCKNGVRVNGVEFYFDDTDNANENCLTLELRGGLLVEGREKQEVVDRIMNAYRELKNELGF